MKTQNSLDAILLEQAQKTATGYVPVERLIEQHIALFGAGCLVKGLTLEEQLKLMEEGASDPDFLADLWDTMDAFAYVDSECQAE